MPVLRGVTWDHPRAVDPLLAAAPLVSEALPGTTIEWTARSLQAFADEPISELATRYDLLIIDHPWVGTVSVDGSLAPLDEHLPQECLDQLAGASVGGSFESYRYAGRQWALPIDAAAQVAAARPDLLSRRMPLAYAEVLELGASLQGTGRTLGMPLIPVDCIMSFLSLSVACGEQPFSRDGIVSDAVGVKVLEVLAQLAELSQETCLQDNPIAVLDRMSSTDAIVYCPLLFGYTNYARRGFRPSVVRFGAPPSLDGRPVGGILGGTGIAVSAASPHRELAARVAEVLTSADVQRALYVRSGGQPAHRDAWCDAEADELCGGFFSGTLAALDAAYVRPRHDGFLDFQDGAGDLLHAHLRAGGDPARVLADLRGLYDAVRSRSRG